MCHHVKFGPWAESPQILLVASTPAPPSVAFRSTGLKIEAQHHDPHSISHRDATHRLRRLRYFWLLQPPEHIPVFGRRLFRIGRTYTTSSPLTLDPLSSHFTCIDHRFLQRSPFGYPSIRSHLFQPLSYPPLAPLQTFLQLSTCNVCNPQQLKSRRLKRVFELCPE